MFVTEVQKLTKRCPAIRNSQQVLLTNSMQQSPSCGGEARSVSHHIFCLLWNTKVNCDVHNSEPPVPIQKDTSHHPTPTHRIS